MSLLNLKADFSPLGEGSLTVVRSKIFTGGEIDVLLSGDVGSEVTITTRVNTSNDLMELLMATDALRGMGAEKIRVWIPCLPYARQDRLMEQGEAFSLRVFADIINAQGYASVTVLDAHSDVGPALIRRCVNLNIHAFVAKVLADKRDYIIVSPDAGAFKKVHKVCKAVGYDATPVICNKVRVHQGGIENITVSIDDFEGRDAYIIDDICDGGRTFIALAEEIRKRNVGKINLIVSHGILSYGEEPLRQGGIDHIYTTDSVRVIDSPYVTQITLRDILKA